MLAAHASEAGPSRPFFPAKDSRMNACCKDRLNSVGLLILRVGVGGYMLTHGWGKVGMVRAGAAFGDPIGIGDAASLYLATFAEFVCAALIVFGLATRFAAVPLVVNMAVAAFVAHRADPWTMEQAAKLFMEGKSQFPASKEFALLYLIPFLTLLFTGAGAFSLDGLIWRWWRGRAEVSRPAEAS